ncbi:MAG: hypothetical protein M5U28_07140 [Sandaracinaceae bacterium]|nr:hypothetical protein [Sandaracinaceae bacterium]
MANEAAEAVHNGSLLDKSRLDGTEEPDIKQLAEAEAEAEKALKEMERQGGGDSTLSKYFREMAGHRVLTPQEEDRGRAGGRAPRDRLLGRRSSPTRPPSRRWPWCSTSTSSSRSRTSRRCARRPRAPRAAS